MTRPGRKVCRERGGSARASLQTPRKDAGWPTRSGFATARHRPVAARRRRPTWGDRSPLLPDYGGACVCNVAPTLLEPPEVWPDVVPGSGGRGRPGAAAWCWTGWDGSSCSARAALAPMLSGMDGGPILTVAPSTTSTAMTSITTGLTPGIHGVVGYRVAVDGAVLNVLRWSVSGRDARNRIPPEKLQPVAAFGGQRPPAVTRADFRIQRLHRRPPRRRPLPRLPRQLEPGGRGHPAAAGRRAVRLRLLRGHRQGGPRVRPGRALRRRAGLRRPAGQRPGRPRCRPGAAMVVTCDHGQVEVGDQIVAAGPRRVRPAVVPVGRGSVPVAARPTRSGPGAAGGDRGPPRRTRAG